MRFNRYQTFYFDYLLEREDEDLEIEVAYTVDDDEVMLQSVTHNGVELETTEAEDRELYGYALEEAQEALAGAQADYGDYLRDSRRDNED
jgi:Ni,Fe-hydrogenase III component G